MTKLTARVGAALATSALVLTASMGSALAKPPTAADTKTYAALGDSFSAGVGAGNLAGNSCIQSQNGYPALIAHATGWDLNYLACSGATIAEVAAQSAAIARGTDYVTVTAGGNDIGFSRILGACATQSEEVCAAAVAQAEKAVRTLLPNELDGLYGAIRVHAGDATVVVMGYPNLFKKGDCYAHGFSKSEINLLNKATDLLNDTIRDRAIAAGFTYADPTPAFKGHASCATVPYVNGMAPQLPQMEWFHPNEAGQVVYARVIARQLGVNGQVTKATAGR